MSAKPKTSNRYANEVSPFVSAELNADLDSETPSHDALEWLEQSITRAEADPRQRHEARMRRDAR